MYTASGRWLIITVTYNINGVVANERPWRPILTLYEGTIVVMVVMGAAVVVREATRCHLARRACAG